MSITPTWIFLAAHSDDDRIGSSSGRARPRGGDDARTPVDDPFRGTIERIRSGDEQAFDGLYRLLYPSLIGFAVQYGVESAVAEELVQEVFLAIWRSRDTWEIHGTLREYLFGAVRNRVFDQRRHARVIRSAEERIGPEAVSGVSQERARSDTMVSEAELRDAVDAVLAAMPVERRQVLTLRWQDGLSYPEIASILGVSVNAAKQQGSRGQRALRDLLERFRP